MEALVLIGLTLVIVLLVDLWLAANIMKSDKPKRNRYGWIALIFLLPVVGWIIWARMGPRGMAKAPASPEHSK
ncbi:PLDc N-terminal domain-containing protein [Pseudomonas saliphila]|uniref:PLDc N-terminal domain-containing protein n=1 Tax=Pseudomonas saliphila TaxID=2586906 RepID=UPI0012397805|nr:PLDc N-terminal domain-containing protein [Pseudomonas saliphila]